MKGLEFNIKNLHLKKVNWFALVGGALTLVLAVSSLFVPWWQITIGQTLAKIGISPVNLSTNIVGYSVAIPVIAAIGWMFMIMLVSAGIVLVFYSIFPTKPYSKRLLGFAYKKPLATVIAFTVLMLVITNVGTIFGAMISSSSMSGADLNIPWSGTKTLELPSSMAQGMLGGITVTAAVEWTFWLAVTAAALCLAARLYHRKLDRPAVLDNLTQPS